MEFIKKWGKTILFPVILSIPLGWLTNFFICQPLYWVTIYILITNSLALYVRKKYPNRILKSDIADLEIANFAGTPLKLSEILLQEFDYVKDTASQAMNDRHTMINYFLLSAGVVITGVGVLVSKEGAVDFRYRDETIVALSLLFCTVGWIYFMQLVRLRQAWCDSALAMNHIKRVFVKCSGNKLEMAEKIFLWGITTIPKANKPMTVFHLSALLISVLSAAAIALAAVILLGEKQIGRFWYVVVVFGLYHLIFQMWMYNALLKETH